MSNVRKRLLEQLDKRQKNRNLRTLKLIDNLIDFSSNDYLGLSSNEKLMASIQESYAATGLSMGSTGSRLLTGNSQLHLELESKLAEFFGAPAALLFNSGYTANLALISTIPQRGDTILYDHAIHACIKEGARLSQANYLSFRHNDPDDLSRKLKRSIGNKFVVVESLYSMEGDAPPIRQFVELCKEFRAELFIDEAHTTAWAGSEGKGWIVDQQLTQKFLARVYTFGKGLGTHGACIVGSQELIDYLINFARPFIYTTALPPHSVISINCALEFLKGHTSSGALLKEKISFYLQQAEKIKVEKSLNKNSPIQWIMTPGNKNALAFSDYLKTSGFDVRPILSPTVPEGKERLRVCIHSFNTKEEILNLISSIVNRP
jgi:8-amino-7-oxononanoate synthase